MSNRTLVTSRYGGEPGQEGDLYLPGRAIRPPVVVLLHGGFWRMPYGRDQLEAISLALSTRGYSVWNLGYRRLGAPGVGWREISADVLSGIKHLAQLQATLDLDRVILVGHSAGGQLALWAAGEQQELQAAGVNICAVVGLAAVSDLEEAWRLGLGNDVVATLLASTPQQAPALYADASPVARLPLGLQQVLFHGDADSAVPVAMSRAYVDTARMAGDNAVLHELPEAGHMEFLDSGTSAFAELSDALSELFSSTQAAPIGA